MLTYDLKKSPGVPLYEALYRCIRGDICGGVLREGEKLPSKRALAQNLEVSKITVEAAYAQLLGEGYIRSVEKVGYFVEKLPAAAQRPAPTVPAPQEREEEYLLDLTGSGPERFPFSVWSRLQREVMLDLGEKLLPPLPNQGARELRQAIAAHLAGFRGMTVDPENIIIGAGTDFLYNLVVQLLGRDRVYALEDPGYGKIRSIYTAAGVRWRGVPLDGEGVRPDLLGDAGVLHISPDHHFPTGRITSLRRRQALLRWAEEQDGYLLEDEYDSEFRFDAHPLPALQSLDSGGRVLYLNTFSKSLAPSIRIGYLILPPGLMEQFRSRLGFYSCTVSSFEQYTLARFLSRGYFEKHINRMRKFYKSRRNRMISALDQEGYTIREEDAGLHFLLKVDTALSDEALVTLWRERGIRVQALSSFYAHGAPPEEEHNLVICYAGIREEVLRERFPEGLPGIMPLPFAGNPV